MNRDFAPDASNKAQVTDITHIRTYEGWLYLAALMDLYSRRSDRRLGDPLLDDPWPGVAGAVVETQARTGRRDSFGSRQPGLIYSTRATVTTDVFDCIEMFYNPIRRHGSAATRHL